MKAAVVEHRGQTPGYAEFNEPNPKPGEVLISVTASAVSPLARGRASGAHYSAGSQFPFCAGVDGVGCLEDGRRVYFILPRAPYGAMAERTVVSDGQWLPLPDGLDDATAAVIANPAMSSWAALTERAHLKAGETVLINGATGAAGRLAVKIARHLGAGRVIATGRKSDVLQSRRADHTILLTDDPSSLEQAFGEVVSAGVDVVLDYLWGTSALALLLAGAKLGAKGVPIRFVQIGAASGGEIPLPAAVLRSSAIILMGSGLGSVPNDRLVASIGAAFGVARSAGLALDHRVVPLRDVATEWNAPDADRRTVFTVGRD